MLFIAIALSAVVGIVLFVLGVYYLRNADLTPSTFASSAVLVFLFSLATYFVLGPIPLEGVPSLTSVPFGYLARLLILSAGLPIIIAYLIGFVVNFLALLGAVRWVQKRLETKIE